MITFFLFQAYNVLAAIVDEYKKINFSTNDCRIIDIDKVEVKILLSRMKPV